MIKLVVRTFIGLPILIIGIIVLSMSAEANAWIISWPLICLALLAMLFGFGVIYKAWKIFRGG